MLANQQNSITNAGYVKIRLIGLKSTNQCVKQNNFSAATCLRGGPQLSPLYLAANDFPDELSFCLFFCPLAAFLFRTRPETQVNKFISAEIGKRFFRSTLLDWKPLQYDLFPIFVKNSRSARINKKLHLVPINEIIENGTKFTFAKN